MSFNIPPSPPTPPDTQVNPYSAPSAAVSSVHDVSEELAAMEYKPLRKLYLRSHNVSTFSALLFIGSLVMGWMFIYYAPKENGLEIDYFGFLSITMYLYFLAAIGMTMRTYWGRIAGIIVSCISLIGFPIGTIFGVAGLFAFVGAPRLFGPNRVTHADLKEAYKARERQRKDEKRAAKLDAKNARRAAKAS